MLRSSRVTPSVIALVAIILLPRFAIAGEPLYFLHTGFGLPWTPDDFRKSSRRGLQLGAGLGVQLRPTLSLAVNAQVHSYEVDADALLKTLGLSPASLGIEGGDVTIFTVFADLRHALYLPLPDLTPIVAVGVGYLWFAQSDRRLIDHAAGDLVGLRRDGRTHVGPAWNASAGLEWTVMEGAAFLAEARFEHALVPGTDIITTALKLGLVWR